MKILFTTESYIPVQCGVSNVVTYLAEGLVKLGHDVAVATKKIAERQNDIINGVEIYEFCVSGNPIKPYSGETDKYINFVLNYNADVIINECSQNWSTDLLLPYLQDIKEKKILHSHGFASLTLKARNPFNRLKFYRYYKTFHLYMKEYDHILYITDVIEDKRYGDKYKITNYSILHNAAEDIFFNEGEELEIIDIYDKYDILDCPFLLNVSNYSKIKNQEDLLKAFYLSNAANEQLILIGSEPTDYLSRLKSIKNRLDKRYSFRNVHFLHSVPRIDLVKFYREAKIFLHSSKREAFPLVIVESMISGTPFISYDVGNVITLPGGVIANNVRNMADMINKLLKNSDELNRLSDMAIEYSKDFKWSKVVDNLNIVLRKVFEA